MADRPETTKSRKAARLGELRAKRIAAAAATAAASTTIVETTETPVNEDASEPPPQGDAAAAAALPSNTPPEPYAMSVTAPVLDPTARRRNRRPRHRPTGPTRISERLPRP